MKNIMLAHGCPGSEERSSNPETRTYDKHWMPWLRKELEKKNIGSSLPLLPEPWNPKYENFKKEFEKYTVNEDSILIGHSCGCAFLVKWLGESKQKIDKLILVAPWKIRTKEDREASFYEYDIDKSLKERVNEIIYFTSNDEEEDGKKSLELYYKDLGGRIINLKDHGHYTFGDIGTEKFPELLDVILK